jgi:eukaryotic-like serine/threonine-protein kinase
MTPARFQTIEEIFRAALEQKPDQINSFLDEACKGDDRLRCKVEALLSSRQRADSFIETSAVGLATKIIQGQQDRSLVGHTIGHYKISESIGTGGMGEVYLATDIVAGRKAALKLLPLRFTGDAERLKRFEQEAHTVVALNHPNIVTVYEIGEDHSIHYIASELIEGETLRQNLARGPMHLSEALDVAIQVAGALAAAHEAGIVHRDIKPENVMLRTDGYVKVLDFGIAKLAESVCAEPTADKGESVTRVETNLGSILGTARYMSPEQTCGVQLDERTDIWSLGVVLYEMVTGHAPFTGETSKEVMAAIREKEPPPFTCYVRHAPAEIQQIVNKALRKDRSQRYRSAQELLHALKGLRHKLEVEADLKLSIAVRSWLYRKRVLGALVFGLLVAAMAVAVPLYWHRNRAISSPSEKSIVVLPFENASNDPNAEYVSEGISEALINSLSDLQRLKVIARSTAFHYKGKDIDPRRVGRELQVAAVLTGRVRQVQDALSIQVDLVDAATGAQVWGEEYHRKISDVVAVKQAIAREITEKLKLKLSGEEQRRLAKDDSTNTEAYRFYLRGRYFWNKRTPGGIKQAITEFQQAIERDPNFALGYVGLADCYTGLTFYNFAAPHEAMPKAKESAIKAVLLDNTVAEGHTSLGHILMNYDWDWPRAEKEFKRSIELKPDYATAHQWYAIHYLTATGRLEEAVQEMRKALELEPASLVMNTFMGATLYYAGRYDEAIDQCRRTVEMDPNFAVAHWHLGLAYEQKQAFDAAIEEFQTAISLSQGSPLMRAALGHAYAKSQRADEANKVLDELNELSKQQYVSPLELAAIYVALGNDDKAFQFLEKAYTEHSFHLVNLNVSPQFKSVRSDPRFQNLVQRLGLSGSASNSARPEKSIAVLPFENLSEDKANAYFVEGIQDEILTRLSKIADLKVISRTSTQHYKNAPENLPEIAKQLGVAHVLEGRVQKSGDAVRVNVQLIKAADDSHLWADTFDRKLTDIFSVESEVAKAIADQLRAKLTGEEEQVIAVKPTDNSEAYDAYLRGLAYTVKSSYSPANASAAQKYFREAVRLDPKFALGWALLSYLDSLGYISTNLQPTVALRDEARQAAETALTLQPNLGEAVLARGFYYYACLKDYESAVRYFEQASQLLPNSSLILESLAEMERRRGHWDRSESYFNRAERLDPRNASLLSQQALSYIALRRFPEALRKFDQVLIIMPEADVAIISEKASIAQAEGDLPRASAFLAPLHPTANDTGALATQVYQAILERRSAQIIPRLKEMLAKPDPALGYFNGELRFYLGWAQEVAADHAAAQESWQQARSELELFRKEQPENYSFIGTLSLINMGLGDKAAAFALTEQAMAAVPIEKDAVFGPIPIEILARVAAQMGEPDRAIAALQKLLSIPYAGAFPPGPLTPALLRLDPMFDPLRNDPRFQKLCEEKQP